MKVIIKFAVNTSSWSNKEVAEFLNNIIDPKSADQVIRKLTPDQINQIKDKFGSEPKLPAKFKEIYQQFKSSKVIEKSSNKLVKLKNLKYLAEPNKWKIGSTSSGKLDKHKGSTYIKNGEVIDCSKWYKTPKFSYDAKSVMSFMLPIIENILNLPKINKVLSSDSEIAFNVTEDSSFEGSYETVYRIFIEKICEIRLSFGHGVPHWTKTYSLYHEPKYIDREDMIVNLLFKYYDPKVNYYFEDSKKSFEGTNYKSIYDPVNKSIINFLKTLK